MQQPNRYPTFLAKYSKGLRAGAGADGGPG